MPEAIQQLYDAFYVNEKPKHIEGCPCCSHVVNLAPLLSQPLAQLTAEDLGTYTGKAMTTVGEVADFQYFLPRILEIIYEQKNRGWPDLDFTLTKVIYGGFGDWPLEQQEAIVTYLERFLFEPELDDWKSEQIATTISGFVADANKNAPGSEVLNAWFHSAKTMERIAEIYSQN